VYDVAIRIFLPGGGSGSEVENKYQIIAQLFSLRISNKIKISVGIIF
jgi:hypothetical protein